MVDDRTRALSRSVAELSLGCSLKYSIPAMLAMFDGSESDAAAWCEARGCRLYTIDYSNGKTSGTYAVIRIEETL